MEAGQSRIRPKERTGTFNNKTSFTLTELLFVVAIIAIVVSL